MKKRCNLIELKVAWWTQCDQIGLNFADLGDFLKPWVNFSCKMPSYSAVIGLGSLLGNFLLKSGQFLSNHLVTLLEDSFSEKVGDVWHEGTARTKNHIKTGRYDPDRNDFERNDVGVRWDPGAGGSRPPQLDDERRRPLFLIKKIP